MFVVNTRMRDRDGTFGHGRMPKGTYRVYEFKSVSRGKEARERKLADIPSDKDTLLLIHGFNNDFEDVTRAYLDFEKQILSQSIPHLTSFFDRHPKHRFNFV